MSFTGWLKSQFGAPVPPPKDPDPELILKIVAPEEIPAGQEPVRRLLGNWLEHAQIRKPQPGELYPISCSDAVSEEPSHELTVQINFTNDLYGNHNLNKESHNDHTQRT